MLGLPACTSDVDPPPRVVDPVPVPVPSPDAAARQACSALIAALPPAIDPGVERRDVAGDPELTAAWGEPPVTLVCGVPAPDRPEEPIEVNGVGWTVRDIGAGFRWTTQGRTVNVAMEIPDAYANGAELVNPVSAPIARLLPLVPSPEPSP